MGGWDLVCDDVRPKHGMCKHSVSNTSVVLVRLHAHCMDAQLSWCLWEEHGLGGQSEHAACCMLHAWHVCMANQHGHQSRLQVATLCCCCCIHGANSAAGMA